MSRENQKHGHDWENKLCQMLNRRTIESLGLECTNTQLRELHECQFQLYPKLGTTRELDRDLDKKKVDITTVNPDRRKDFPFNIQAKTSTSSTVPYPKLLFESKLMNETGIPVVFQQQTETIDGKEETKDTFAILYLDDFLNLIYKQAELLFDLKMEEYYKV